MENCALPGTQVDCDMKGIITELEGVLRSPLPPLAASASPTPSSTEEEGPSLTELACVSLRKVCTSLLLSPHTDATNGKDVADICILNVRGGIFQKSASTISARIFLFTRTSFPLINRRYLGKLWFGNVIPITFSILKILDFFHMFSFF